MSPRVITQCRPVLSKHKMLKTTFLLSSLLLSNCNVYYLQNATVLTDRKTPTITTNVGENRLIDLGLSASYSDKRAAKFTQGAPADSVYRNTMDDTGNVKLCSNYWNVNLQAAVAVFYKKSENKRQRLRFLTDLQAGQFENMFSGNKQMFLDFKFGPTYSLEWKKFATHPRILTGVSRINAKYDVLVGDVAFMKSLQDSPYSDYYWTKDSGEVDSYGYFIEAGNTFELFLNKYISLLTDLSGTFEYLFEYPGDNNVYVTLSYLEISPAVKINLSKSFTIVSGISVPYNPDYNVQLPCQFFMRVFTSVGPLWGK